MQVGLSTQNAPSVWVVVPHFLIGAVNFIIASLLVVFHFDELLKFNLTAPLLAITHLMILGWVTIVIFGALYQLIPVVMEVKLYSEKLAYVTLGLMIVGLIFLISGFLNFEFQFSHSIGMGASLVILSVLLFTFNTLKSAAASKKKSISRLYIIASGFYLLLNVSLGLFITLNMSYDWILVAHTEFLKAHLVIGLVGWFLMLIIGVSARLMPMFLIVHKLKEGYLKWGFYLINAGIISIFIMVWFTNYPKILFDGSLLLILLGLIMFLLYNYDVFSHRMRKKLDSGMKPTAISLIIFGLSLVVFIAVFIGDSFFGLPAGRLEVLAGILMIYGFFTGIILGQTYKTLPFIIWLFYYQKLVGRQKTPLPSEMFNEKLIKVHTWSFTISIVLFIIGLLFSSAMIVLGAAIAMLFTSLVYGVNASIMIFHKKQTIK